MKLKSITLCMLLSSSVFASTQAHFNDARSCVGTIESTTNSRIGHFVADVGEFSPDRFGLVDSKGHYSFLSPKMGRDPNTGGYIGKSNDEIYRANYLPTKDIFEIISSQLTVTAVCDR